MSKFRIPSVLLILALLLSFANDSSTFAAIGPTSFGAGHYATGALPHGVAIGDLDGEGKPDLAVTNYQSATVSVFRNISLGPTTGASFAAKVDFTMATGKGWSVAVVIGDLNGDGKPELVVTNVLGDNIAVFRNTSTTGTISFSRVDFAGTGSVRNAVLGDLDGDGKLDLATTDSGYNKLSVFRNTSTGTGGPISFAAPVDFAAGSGSNGIAIGDLDGDGKPDVAVTNQTSGTVSVFRNTSTSGTITAGSFAAKVDFATGAEQTDVVIGDLDGDGKPDLAVTNRSADTVSVFRNTGTSGPITAASFEANVDFTTGASPLHLAIGDLDGDGKLDLAVTNSTISTVSVLRNTSTSGTITAASFAAKVAFGSGASPQTIAIGDLNGDGKPDMVVSAAGNNVVYVLHNITPNTNLSIGDANLDASDGTFSVPVEFTSGGASVASVGFSLDYQETCLSFDASDGNSDGMPDSITGLPAGFAASIMHDANDSDGELDIAIFDDTGLNGALSGGVLLTVQFDVLAACITTDGTTTDVTVDFSNNPAPSFGDQGAGDVPSPTPSTGGTLTLEFNATPTDIALSNSSVNENEASGTAVGSLSTTDPDAGDSHTYSLVAGTGDTDNGSFAIDGDQIKTAASFNFEVKNSYSVRIRTTDNGGLNGTFEKEFTVTVNNVNEAPVAQDDPVDPLTTVVVGTNPLAIDVLANDSDPDAGTILTVDALTQPAAGSATDNDSDVTFTGPDDNGTASFTYQATDGSLNSAAATVTVNHVKNDLRGDCNSSGSVTAADFTATVLEIFDSSDDPLVGGNPAWWRIYDPAGYAGSPLGCDANASENGVSNTSDSVTAADIICTVLVFFGDTSCTQPISSRAHSGRPATLAAPLAQPANAGSTTDVSLFLDSGGNGVAAAAFALVLDPQVVGLDTADADGDGLPDAVTVHAPPAIVRSVSWDAAANRLEVALFSFSNPLPTLPDGVLLTVRLNVVANATTGSTPLMLTQVSLGDAAGGDIAANGVDGSLTITGASGTGSLKTILLPVVTQ